MKTLHFMLSAGLASLPALAQCIEPTNTVNISDSYDCNAVEVYWEDVPNATNYLVYRSQADNPGYAYIGENAASPYYDWDAPYDVQLTYYIITVGDCGTSVPSMTYSAIRSSYVAPPAWVSATDNQYCDLIVVDWGINSWAPFWYIYRSESPDFNTATWIGDASYPPFDDYSPAGNVGYYYWVVGANDCGQSAPGGPDIGYSNFGLYLYDSPHDTTVTEGESTSLSVSVSDFGAFEWYGPYGRIDDDGHFSGAYTDTLTINTAYESDEGYYYCIVYGGCGSVESEWAYLTVEQSTRCPADLSGSSDPNDPVYGVPDGSADASDFFYYLDQFAANNILIADLTGSADPNNPVYGSPDGTIDASDFFYFLDLFVAGCP